MREVEPVEQLLLIEDTPEIRLRHANGIGLVAVRGDLVETSVSSEDLLTATLRLRPDRIIVGELRGAEVSTCHRAANTGHPGSMSTLHADTPVGTFEQLAMLARQGAGDKGRSDTNDYARTIIDVVVQLARIAGNRLVS